MNNRSLSPPCVLTPRAKSRINKTLNKIKWPNIKTPFVVEKIDLYSKMVWVSVHSYFVEGSDSACEDFGQLMYKILTVLPNNWRVFVTNEWVPSKYNPINLEWSKKLKEYF